MTSALLDEQCLLGIEAIDQQHRQLFDLIGEFNRLIASRAGATAIQELLKRFHHQAEIHFAAEETLLAVTGFAGRHAHILEHHAFLGMLDENIRQIATEPRTLDTEKVSRLLTNWLRGHILEIDRGYLPHLKERIRNKAPGVV